MPDPGALSPPGPRLARLWRLGFGLLGLAALTLQFGLMLSNADGAPLSRSLINFFSYFTILTNLLVAFALLAPAIDARGVLGRWMAGEGVRAAVTMYAMVVGLTYHLLLARVWSPEGWWWLADTLLHTAMPLAMLVDWLLFTPKGRLRWLDAVKWLLFPAVFGAWTLAHGALSGWYPYWFIDVGELGLERAAINFAGLLAVFLVLGLAVVAIDRVIGRKRTPVSDSAA